VHYKREPRLGGKSKYSLMKMVRFATDGILSFSIMPLKLAIWTGFAAIWLAVLGIIIAVLERVYRLYDINIGRGWASIFIAVLFMGGVQLLTLGIIGEYLGRIYTEVKRRPLYVVQERLGFEKEV
jgi:dolichol-phosphate mannosyltransferase